MSTTSLALAPEPQSPEAAAYEKYSRGLRARLHNDRDFRKAVARQFLQGAQRAAVNPGTVHVDRFLTNLSIGYTNDELIGDKLMPVVPVTKRSDKIFKFSKRGDLNGPDDLGAPRARANEIELDYEEDNYSVKDYFLQAYVDRMTEENADEVYLELLDMTEELNRRLAIKRELRIAAIVTNTANYGGNTAPLTGVEWNEAVTPHNDPLPGIQAAIASLWSGGGRTRLVGATTIEVLHALMQNERIRELFKYTTGGLASRQQIAGFFGLDDLYVTSARYDSANIGQTPSYQRIWPNVFAIVRVMATPSRRTAAFGATFRWTPGSATTQWFDPEPGNMGGTYTKVAFSEDYKVLAPDTSYLFTNVLV